LRLHHRYSIAGKLNCKFGEQRVGPFRVIRRVGCLAYKLDLPSNLHIYPIVSVAQLEPTPAELDPYERPQPDYPDAVIVNGDTEEWKSYEIKQLIDKC